MFSFSTDHAVNASAISPQDDDTPDRALAAIQDTIGVTPDSDDAKLQFRSMYDIANQFLDYSGKIDFKAFQEVMRKESNLNAIRDIGGQDAVDFFKQIGQLKQGMERHFELFEKKLQREQRIINEQTEILSKQKKFYNLK